MVQWAQDYCNRVAWSGVDAGGEARQSDPGARLAGVVFRIIDEKSILVSTKYVVRCFTLYALCYTLCAFLTKNRFS